MPLMQVSDSESVAIIPNSFRKSGNVFKGWCTSKDAQVVIEFPHTFKQDVTLYPKWEKITQSGKITFDSNGGEGTTLPLSCSDNMAVTAEMVGHSFSPPTRDMIFAGYTIKESKPSSRKTLAENELVQFPYYFKSEVCFAAVWKTPEYYNVNLVYSDNLLPTQIVQLTPNSMVDDFASQPIEQYLFAGWFTSQTYEPETQVIFPIQLTSNNSVFYAKMIPYSIDGSISYEPNGAFGSMVPSNYHKGIVVSEPLSQFRNPGYDFGGWYTSPSCKDEERVIFPLYFEESIVIYPKWIINIPQGQCLLVYNLDPKDGVIESSLQKIYDYDNPHRIYLQRPPKLEREDGSKFFAWTVDFGYFFNFNQEFTTDEYKLTKDKILNIYPCYTKKAYKITYHLEQGERGDVSPVYINPDLVNQTDFGLPYYVVTKTGYVLSGWALNKDDLEKYRPHDSVKVAEITSDIDLYAKFRRDTTNTGGNQPKYAGETLWVKGIEPFPESRWIQRQFLESKSIPWKFELDHNKWWDAKKLQPSGNGRDSNLCWAACASNVLHWWYFHNSDYITKYFELNPNNKKPVTTFPNVKESAIFDEFKRSWPNNGGYTQDGVDWWLAGSNKREGGGYFKDVFPVGEKIYEDTASAYPTKRLFNEFITQSLEAGRACVWYTTEVGPHATTIYGAKYNDEGWIDTIYYVDNDHLYQYTTTKEIQSIIEAPIFYFDYNVDLPKSDLETNPAYQTNPCAWIRDKTEGYAIRITQLSSYDLRRDLWQKYFESKQQS